MGNLGVGIWMIEAFYLYGSHAAGGGFWLGLICGLLLFALTRTYYWPSPAALIGYRRTAGPTCALGSAVRAPRSSSSAPSRSIFVPRAPWLSSM
jgi:hypothetical protein